MYPHTNMHAQIHGRTCTQTTYIKKSVFSLYLLKQSLTDIFFMYLLKQWKSLGIAAASEAASKSEYSGWSPALCRKATVPFPLNVGFEACSTGRNSCLRRPWSHVCKVRLLLLSMLSNCPLSVYIPAHGQCCSQPWPQKLLPHWEACTTYRG